MLGWKEIIQDHIIKNYDRVKKATRPLHDHLGVSYFTYHRVDKAGKYTVLLDRPDWGEHYVEHKLFLQDPYLRHPDVYQKGFCLVEANGSDEYRESLLKNGKIFNLDLGVILIEKGPDYVEFFGFCGNKATSCLEKLYLNQPALLKSFAAHFKKEFDPILVGMQDEASPLIHLIGEDFNCKAPIKTEISSNSIHAYLKDLGLENEVLKASSLSKRERDCIRCLLQGMTAKEIAVLLQLSPRTVEFYFENIKNKLSCWSKQEVFSTAKRLQELGLL